jgi:predicted outer membrane repeat protein
MSLRFKVARSSVCAALLVLALLPWATPAQAATFTVTTTTDAPHALPIDETCTSTLQDKACTLRAAVQATNFASGAHTINLAVAGTYTLTVTGQGEDQAATGDLDILTHVNLTIKNTSGGLVVISGPGGEDNDRIFDVADGTLFNIAQFSISDVTIKTGRAKGANGGGIRNGKGDMLTVTNVTLSGNTADSGGGIATRGTATLTNVTLGDNVATFFGGGVYSEAAGTEGTGLTLNAVTFTNNSAGRVGSGGGLASFGGATLNDVTFNKNRARSHGGGFYNEGAAVLKKVTFTANTVEQQNPDALARGGGIANLGSVTFSDGTLDSNTAQYGGGIYNAGTVTLSNVTASSNSAGSSGPAGGGAYYGDALSTQMMSSSTFVGNQSQFGSGAILNLGTATLTNITLDANTAGTVGGAIETGGTATLTNVTISDSLAQKGSGILSFGGTATLRSTIVATQAGYGSNCLTQLTGVIVSAGSNISSDGTCPFTAGGDYNSTDPLLNTLQLSPPGTTATRPLLPGSPAIDAVLGACPPPATDQRGVSRPQSSRCDIGAFEVVASTGGPTAVDDGYSGVAGSGLTVPAPGVLGNDTAPGSGTLTATQVTSPRYGTLTLRSDGSFTYLPGADFPGRDTFTYRASDGTFRSQPATVTLTGTAAPCAPRPIVRTAPVVSGGALQVTVTATAATGLPSNRLVELRFGSARNARVTIGGQTQSGSFTYPVTGNVSELTFTVTRATPGQPTTVPLVVVDDCGEWPTFVGGGSAAGF